MDFSSEEAAASIPFAFLLGQDGVHVLLRGQDLCVVPAKDLYFHPLKYSENGSVIPPDCSSAVKQSIQATPVFTEDETVSLPYDCVFEKIRIELIAGDQFGDYEAYTYTNTMGH